MKTYLLHTFAVVMVLMVATWFSYVEAKTLFEDDFSNGLDK